MKLYATVHHPLSHQGSRFLSYPLRPGTINHTDNVASFKKQMEPIIGVSASLMTVIYKSSIKSDEDILSQDEFTPCAEDRCFIHIRVEDLEMQARVREIVARGFESMVIPLDQVTVGD